MNIRAEPDGRIDRAPGDPPSDLAAGVGRESPDGYTPRAAIRIAVIGLVLALALTAASFQVATGHFIWAPNVPIALVVLAIAQIGVHLVFFLHISTGPDNTNNVLALAFGILIVFLVGAGTLWIMSHLNANMMPMEMMQHG